MKSFNLKASINSKLEKFYHQYNLRKVLWRGNALKIIFLPLVSPDISFYDRTSITFTQWAVRRNLLIYSQILKNSTRGNYIVTVEILCECSIRQVKTKKSAVVFRIMGMWNNQSFPQYKIEIFDIIYITLQNHIFLKKNSPKQKTQHFF